MSLYIYIFFAFLLSGIVFCYTDKQTRIKESLTLLTLGLTAVVLIWNTNENIKQNLRPVILTDFSLVSSSTTDYWQQFKNGTGIIFFSVFDHIATNISGYIVENHKKINLDFSIGGPVNSQGGFKCPSNIFQGSPVKWITTATGLCGYLNGNPSTTVSEDNIIYLKYEDINGNEYCTKEDKNLSINSRSFSDSFCQ